MLNEHMSQGTSHFNWLNVRRLRDRYARRDLRRLCRSSARIGARESAGNYAHELTARRKFVPSGTVFWRTLASLIMVAVFAGGLARPVHALPPLPTFDEFEPHSLDAPISHLVYDDVNLFTRSLFGASYVVGPLEFQYDESYAESSSTYLGNLLGNFTFKSYTFVDGVTIGLPVLDGTIVRDGVFRYALGALQNPESGWDYQFRALAKSGRYVAVYFTGGGVALDDSMLQIRYELAPVPAFPWIQRPVRAKFPDGEDATIEWNDTLFSATRFTPARITLRKQGNEIEKIEFDWNTSTPTRVTRVRSTIAGAAQPWRSLGIEYETTVLQPLARLARVTLGGDSIAPFGAGIVRTGVRFGYQVAGTKDIVTSLQNFQGKTLKTYFVSSGVATAGGPTRTLYTGTRQGTTQQLPTQFGYTPSSAGIDRYVTITRPQLPNDPLTVRLDSQTGSSMEERRASCPDPLHLVETYTGGPFQGLVQRETLRATCTEPVVISYQYTSAGVIEYMYLTAIDSSGALTTHTVRLRTENHTDANGLRKSVLTESTDAMGNLTQWTYDFNGKALSERYVPDGIQSNITYTYWDAEQRHVRTVRFTDAGGRVDEEEYDQRGFSTAVRSAVGSTLQVATTTSYDSALRPDTVLDTRGKTHRFTYLPDGRLQSVVTTAPGGQSQVSSTFQYNPDFPQEQSRLDTVVREPGGQFTSTLEWLFVPNLPLISQVRASGDGIAQPLLLTDLLYDLPTLRLQRSCEYKSASSTEGCNYFYYYPTASGYKTGLLQRVDIAGGIGAGGYTKNYLYDSVSDYYGTNYDDGIEDKTTVEELDGFGLLRQVLVNPGEGVDEEQLNFTFDANKKLIRQSRSIGGVLLSDVQATFDDDGRSDRVVQIAEPVSGAVSVFQYNDALKRLTDQASYSTAGLLRSSLSFDRGSFDLFDRPRITQTFDDGRGYSNQVLTVNNVGDLTSYRNDLSGLLEYSYDSFGRLQQQQSPLATTTRTYSISGSSFVATDTNSNRTTDSSLRFTHQWKTFSDAFGRAVHTEDVTGGAQTDYYFNARGFLDRSVFSFPDAPSRTYRNTFDALGRSVGFLLNGEALVSRSFSGLGRLLSLSDASYNETSYLYDRLGRTRQISYPDGSAQTLLSATRFYPRRANGAVFRSVYRDRSGAQVTTEVSPYGQMLLTQSSGGELPAQSVTATYNGHRLTSMSQSNSLESSQLSVGYDSYGRATSERTTVTSSAAALDYTVRRGFDNLGQLTSYTYPDSASTIVTYIRDAFGRIDQVLVNGGLVADYSYDGPVLTQLNLGDVTRTFTYDSTSGAPSNIVDRHSSDILTNVAYEYDSQYRQTSRIDSGLRRGSTSGLSESFVYDSDDMLSRYDFASPVFGSGNRSYLPSLDGLLYAVSSSVNEMFELPTRFAYDSYGNPTSEYAAGRQFSWTKSGIRRLTNSGLGLSADFLQDALNRTVWFRKRLPSFTRDTLQVRESGMVLFQNEVNR